MAQLSKETPQGLSVKYGGGGDGGGAGGVGSGLGGDGGGGGGVGGGGGAGGQFWQMYFTNAAANNGRHCEGEQRIPKFENRHVAIIFA